MTAPDDATHVVEVNEMNAVCYGTVDRDRFVEFTNHRAGTRGGGMGSLMELPCLDRDHADWLVGYLVDELGLSRRHVRVKEAVR